MRNFTAQIKNKTTGEVRTLLLKAQTISQAIVNSAELSFRNEAVVQVLEQGDW